MHDSTRGSAGKPRLVFVSHDSRDTWGARQIARALREAGASVFLDEAEVEVGEDFAERILEVLEAGGRAPGPLDYLGSPGGREDCMLDAVQRCEYSICPPLLRVKRGGLHPQPLDGFRMDE